MITPRIVSVHGVKTPPKVPNLELSFSARAVLIRPFVVAIEKISDVYMEMGLE